MSAKDIRNIVLLGHSGSGKTTDVYKRQTTRPSPPASSSALPAASWGFISSTNELCRAHARGIDVYKRQLAYGEIFSVVFQLKRRRQNRMFSYAEPADRKSVV